MLLMIKLLSIHFLEELLVAFIELMQNLCNIFFNFIVFNYRFFKDLRIDVGILQLFESFYLNRRENTFCWVLVVMIYILLLG